MKIIVDTLLKETIPLATVHNLDIQLLPETMPDNVENKQKMRMMPFQYALTLLGYWYTCIFESENSKGQWSQEQHLYSNILVLLKPWPRITDIGN